MTLYEIIGIFKRIALTQPNIRTATDGSIYDVLNNNPSIQYDVFHIQQTTHQEDFETDYYGLTLFYDTRLDDDLESNRLLYQSTGKELLGNIIRTFCENWGIDFPTITYTPYTQRFVNLDCGVYCNIRLEVPKDIICADDYLAEVVPGSGIKLQDMGITITQNGLIVVTPGAEYDGIGEIRIETNVPQSAAVLQDKEVEYTENGSYTIHPDPAYDGLSSVSVDVDVPDNYERGYDDGKEDGAAEQKSKLVPTAVTENGTYSRPDGFSQIVVAVPQTGQTINNQDKQVILDHPTFFTVDLPEGRSGWYSQEVIVTADSGYTGLGTVTAHTDFEPTEAISFGEERQKEKLIAVTFSANGVYNRVDGWSSVTINVPQGQGYDEGYEDGEAAQKAKLVPTAVTENGTYSREDGFSQIVVNVPDRYDDGYDAGFAAGAAACSGLQISSITLNVASAITDNGTATTTYSPSTAYTDIYYTSSDPSKATINENTGAITVIAAGTVTICARDRMSGLRDCKQVAVARSTPSNANVLDFIYVTTGANQTNVLFNGTAQGDNAFFDKFYNAIIRMDIDGVPVRKSEANINTLKPYKRYLHTFPTAGRHNVKYYMSRQIIDATSPGLVLTDLIFGDNLGEKHLVEANVGRGYEKLGYGVFQGGGELTAVTLPNTVTDLGPYTFEYTAIRRLTIPDSVTGITVISPGTEIETEGLFNHCEQMTGVTIGKGLTSIHRYTFRGCTALRNVEMRRATPPAISEHLFDDCPNLAHIYVPASAVNAYKTATGWSAYANKISASS